MVIRRVGVWSAAKISGTLYAGLGLIFGCIFAVISVLGAGMAAEGDAPAWFGAAFGVGAVVFLPILYGVLGILFGAVTAALYNLFAGLVGGLEIEMHGTSA